MKWEIRIQRYYIQAYVIHSALQEMYIPNKNPSQQSVALFNKLQYVLILLLHTVHDTAVDKQF
jgi:hypothetical protein